MQELTEAAVIDGPQAKANNSVVQLGSFFTFNSRIYEKKLRIDIDE